jgi:hypothetical protein
MQQSVKYVTKTSRRGHWGGGERDTTLHGMKRREAPNENAPFPSEIQHAIL